jgi:hypothetical protein
MNHLVLMDYRQFAVKSPSRIKSFLDIVQSGSGAHQASIPLEVLWAASEEVKRPEV